MYVSFNQTLHRHAKMDHLCELIVCDRQVYSRGMDSQHCVLQEEVMDDIGARINGRASIITSTVYRTNYIVGPKSSVAS